MLSTSIFSLSIHLNAHLFVYRIVFGCSRGRDYSNSFDFGALSVFCYYFWLNYTPLVALTRNQANINFFSFCIGRACGGWLAGWLACFVYALSWFILFLLVFFPLGWQQSEKRGPWFFVCIRLWFNYIWLYSVYELYITSHNCLLYALHKLLSFKQQLRCIAATFFLLYLACSFVSLYFRTFFFFLDNFWFWKISIKTKCLPKDWARYFLIRVFFLLLRRLLLPSLRYGLLFIFYENISCWARYMTYIKKHMVKRESALEMTSNMVEE